MKPTAWLIGTTRGGVVDVDALFDALQVGRIAGAALDVSATETPERGLPLLHPNAVVSPHCAGITKQAYERLAMAAAYDTGAALRGERPKGMIEPAAWPQSRAATASAISPPSSTPLPERA